MNDLDLAFAMERLILGGQLQLPCNCILDVLCTMPGTLWMRTNKYVHHCPAHPGGKRGRSIMAKRNEPFWFDVDGRLLEPDEFTAAFKRLTAEGILTLVPGFTTDVGRTKLPSLISMEGR